jgi:hypothetical protein
MRLMLVGALEVKRNRAGESPCISSVSVQQMTHSPFGFLVLWNAPMFHQPVWLTVTPSALYRVPWP